MPVISHDPRVRIIEDGTPEAYFLTACEYRSAVITLRVAYPHEMASGITRPICHLIGMSAELSMKSFLLKCGTDKSILKNQIGHNLSKLLDECVKCGLAVSDKHMETIKEFSLVIETHYFRYGREPNSTKLPWPIPLVEIDEAIAAMNALADGAARKLGRMPLLPT